MTDRPSPPLQRAERYLLGSPKPDVGVREWNWRDLAVALAVMLTVFAVAAVVLPTGTGWRLLALVTGIGASMSAERRFRRWRLSRR